MKLITIDLNCDLGESFGAFSIGQDQQILPLITSANIACGFHAGDPSIMDRTVFWATQHQVRIGAHPSLPDLQGFGRRKMEVSPEEVYHLMIYQMGSLSGFTQVHHTQIKHVKPHGALYQMSAKDPAIAEAIAEAVYDFNPHLILYGLAQSPSIKMARKKGLRVAEEIFADRTYQPDGSLTPRALPQAIIHRVDQAVQQVIQILTEQRVTTVTGEIIPLRADTVCIHGDHPQALHFIQALRATLDKHQIQISPPDRR